MADHEHGNIRHNEHLILDQPLLRLSNELLRKNFRSAHFTIEKDTSAVKTLLKDTANAAAGSNMPKDEVLKNIDAILSKMRGIKRKLTSYAAEEAKLHEQVDARITHLGDLYTMKTVEDVKYESWSRKRLDRLLVDYLLRHGYNESAEELARERGMEDLVDVETFSAMSRIRSTLLEGSVTEALAWCTENKKELRKMDSSLEFNLRFQQYVELVRAGTPLEAVTHAKRHLMPYITSFPREVSKACGLLAYPPHCPSSVEYEQYYSRSRWVMLADLFAKTHNQLLSLPAIPLLHVALSAGLSALKTPACHSKATRQTEDTTTLTHGVCPICSTELNDLARNVPYAHHTKSHVEPDLLLLPNGNVAGKERMEDLAKKGGFPGLVKDPKTGDVFKTSLAKKVYIS